ncbi:MAG: efflux RND transporter periplasmic adaptor subunit [Hyphomicrobiaceae bacterium]|nr:efflux RND transporter periplasmic adaptor subunit [Hyphomicrobiaceae bacterium]
MNIHHQSLQNRPDAGELAERAGFVPPKARGGLWAKLIRIALKSVLPIVVIAAGFAGFRYLRDTRPEVPKQPIAERAFTVDAITARPGTYKPTLTLYGTTVAGRQVDIRALVAGRVEDTSTDLREGGLVASGDILLSVDRLDYETTLAEAEAQLAETRGKIREFEASIVSEKSSLTYAKAQLQLAKADLERAEPLASRGAVSERTVDDRKQILLQREQAADQIANMVTVWEARVAQQQAVASRLETVIARSRQRLADTRLAAPFDAYVTEVGAQVGRMLGVNDKVATLIDRNWIEVRLALSDDQYGRIVSAEGSLEGRKVTVRWVLGDAVFSYPAAIARIGSRIVADTGGVEVFARVTRPLEPVPLRPGAFVEVLVPDQTFTDVYKLPASALYAGKTVYAIVDGRLAGRSVKVVGGDAESVLVAGDVRPGDQIVTTRISTPGDGVLVMRAAGAGA